MVVDERSILSPAFKRIEADSVLPCGTYGQPSETFIVALSGLLEYVRIVSPLYKTLISHDAIASTGAPLAERFNITSVPVKEPLL